MAPSIEVVTREIERKSVFLQAVQTQLSRVVVGQRYLIDRLLISLMSGGHVLLEGVPGLAKTTAVKTLASCLSCDFRRIQFTPDLLPADLLGTQIYRPQTGEFTIRKGPIFSQILLADEINRAPAKVQSALLEVMQERQVTIADQTFELGRPFLVMATQNPIEQEGTYPLPEAQVDRFMFKLKVGYPTRADEKEIMRRVSAGLPSVESVATTQDILSIQDLLHDIHVDERIEDYVVDLVIATREPKRYGMDENLIQFGASPRSSIFLLSAARAHAVLQGRAFVTPQDVKSIAPDVLRHRILLSYEAEAENLSSDDIIERLLVKVEVP